MDPILSYREIEMRSHMFLLRAQEYIWDLNYKAGRAILQFEPIFSWN